MRGAAGQRTHSAMFELSASLGAYCVSSCEFPKTKGRVEANRQRVYRCRVAFGLHDAPGHRHKPILLQLDQIILRVRVADWGRGEGLLATPEVEIGSLVDTGH